MDTQLSLNRLEDIRPPAIDEATFAAAVTQIRRHARDRDELEEFMSMIAPDPWHCCECGKPYVVPTLARACEQRHEESKETAA